MRWLPLALALAVAACGSPRRDGPPEDEVLTRLAGSATRALQLDEPESAARLYGRALARARERDDAGAIADMGFGQATALLADGDAPGALRVAQEVRAELARRRITPSPTLLLAEATALHRLGRAAEAEPLARDVVARGSEDAAAALRAHFLLGLLAVRRQDVAGVAEARAALEGATSAAFRADAVELAAQESLLRGAAARAAADAARAAALRRDALDYRGVSRALAVEGLARAQLGERQAAANLLFRAGRGAAARGEAGDARLWLTEAARLGSPAAPAALAELRGSESAEPSGTGATTGATSARSAGTSGGGRGVSARRMTPRR